MDEEQIEAPDTQDEPTDAVEEIVEVAEDEESNEPETEEESELDFGLEGEKEEVPASSLDDLRELIKSDPESALTRVGQVEQGLAKLQSQKEEAESLRNNLNYVFDAIKTGEGEAIDEFLGYLEQRTGMTVEDFARHKGLTLGDEVYVDPLEAKIKELESRQSKVEAERIQTRWVMDKGVKLAPQIERVTGFPVTADEVYSVLPYLTASSRESDVIRLIRDHNPKAYIRLLESKVEPQKAKAPKAAMLPSARSGKKLEMKQEYDPAGWNAARAAKLAMQGK